MGMDVNMLACVRALAENRIQDAKKYAVCCCANDNTKKNESQVKRCKNLLLNGPNMIELPANLNGLLRMEDVSSFHAERYYLGKTQWDLFEKIKRGVAVKILLIVFVYAVIGFINIPTSKWLSFNCQKCHLEVSM